MAGQPATIRVTALRRKEAAEAAATDASVSQPAPQPATEAGPAFLATEPRTASPAPVAGGRTIRVGSFGQPENARRTADRLTEGGVPARVAEVRQGGTSLWTVLAGPAPLRRGPGPSGPGQGPRLRRRPSSRPLTGKDAPVSLPRLFLALILSLVTALPALAFDTRARAAWVYDVTTHTVLLDKNAHEPLPPALDVQAHDAEHAVRGAARRACDDGDHLRRLDQGQADGRVEDVRRGARPAHRRGADPRHHRELGQRRLRGCGRGAERHRKRLRPRHDCPRQGAGDDRLDLHQLLGLARPRPPDERARSGHPRGAADRGIPGVLSLFLAHRVQLQGPGPLERQQPQPAAAPRAERRLDGGRAEDRAHAGGGLRPRGLGGAEGRPPHRLRADRPRDRGRPGAGRRADRELGLSPVRPEDAGDQGPARDRGRCLARQCLARGAGAGRGCEAPRARAGAGQCDGRGELHGAAPRADRRRSGSWPS